MSETLRPRALIFGMWHDLVDLYQRCSNYAPGANIDPTQVSHVLLGLYWENMEKSSCPIP